MKLFPLAICSLATVVSLTATVTTQVPLRGQVDRYGDPLPKGAVRRMGTLRFTHPGGIASVAVSHDGKLVATGGGNPSLLGRRGAHSNRKPITIRIWQAATGKLLREFAVSRYSVTSLCFSPDDTSLFGACKGELNSALPSLNCWNVETGQRLWKTEVTESLHVAKLEFSKNKRLVSYHLRGTEYVDGNSHEYRSQPFIRIWDPHTGKLLPQKEHVHVPVRQVSPNPAVFMEAIARSADGRFTAVAIFNRKKTKQKLPNGEVETSEKYFDSHVKIFDNHTNVLVRELRGFEHPCYSVALSPDGRVLAAAAGMKLWLIQMKTGKKQLIADVKIQFDKIEFRNAGKVLVASTFMNLFLYTWDVTNGKQLSKHGLLPWRGFGLWGATAFEKQLFVINTQYALYFWNWKTGKAITSFPGHRIAPQGLCFRSTNKLVSWGINRYEWNWKIGTLARASVIPYRRFRDATTSLASNMYVTSHGTQSIAVRDFTSQKTIHLLKSKIDLDSLSATRFSPSGKTMLLVESGDKGDAFHFFHLPTAKLLSTIRTATDQWSDWGPLAFSPDDRFAAVQTKSKQVIVLDLREGKITHRWRPAKKGAKTPASLTNLRFSTNGPVLLAAEGELRGPTTSIFGWHLKTGKPILQTVINSFQDGYITTAADAAFSPDGRLLALATYDRNLIELREVASGRIRAELHGHMDLVSQLAFSPDGQYLASGSHDTTILIWDVQQVLRPTRPSKKRLTKTDLLTHWTTLAGADAKKANIAIWSLVAAAEDSVPFLQKHLSLRTASPRQLQQWLADLDSKRYAVRVRAMRQLQQVGESVVPALRRALAQKPTLEVHLRLTKLLEELSPLRPTPNRLRQSRAVEVLERINNAASRRLLRELAAGPEDAWLTLEARKWGG